MPEREKEQIKEQAPQPGLRLPSVIIPVFNAAADLDRCLSSVHRTVPAGTVVLVIDDASDDEAVTDVLESWTLQTGPEWRLDRNGRNLGFVATANKGMDQLAGNVVLLNSDTITTNGWLEGLDTCLHSSSDIATATPWTNNGEIASLPVFCANNPLPGRVDDVARIIADYSERRYPEIPTAVGFCMAISRKAIDLVGLFDEATFGMGYGEENDFSVRSAELGLRNVLCDNVYVGHAGGRSFGPRGLSPDNESMQRLLNKHPHYLEEVMAFIESDPLDVVRQPLLEQLRAAAIELG